MILVVSIAKLINKRFDCTYLHIYIDSFITMMKLSLPSKTFKQLLQANPGEESVNQHGWNIDNHPRSEGQISIDSVQSVKQTTTNEPNQLTRVCQEQTQLLFYDSFESQLRSRPN